MGRTHFILVITLLVFGSCSKNPEQYIDHIEGYWQIHHVEQNSTLIKEYSATGAIDYFKINEDGTGFRKKVTPTMDGTLLVSEHQVTFEYKIEHDSLNIYYRGDDIEFKETIKLATETELVISNSRGYSYSYQPYNISRSD